MKLEQLQEIAMVSCRLAPGSTVLVGFSGGPDSLCLLDGLARLGFPLVAAHFDHRLRPESSRDAETVSKLARQMHVPFVLGSQDVAGFARGERLSLEEAARVLRYRFLFASARQHAAQAVAVGHTADDQVETFLMHLLRGSGLSGLTGMAFRSLLPAWDAEIPLVRPLLSFWREETVAYCAERGLQPVFDASNQDVTFFRNRLRHELIPLLETYNPRAREVLWRTSQVLAGDEEIITGVLERGWEACLADQGPGWLALHGPTFLEYQIGLQRRILRRAVEQLRPSIRDVDFAAIERALAFFQSPAGGPVDLVQGIRLMVEGDRLLVVGAEELPAARDWPQLAACEAQALAVPGEVSFSGGWRIVAEWVEERDMAVKQEAAFSRRPGFNWEVWLDAATLPGPLAVRRPRPGDRFQPLGLQSGSVKLSDFWINEKLPRRARAAWPVVVAGDALVWLPGFRPAHPFRIRETTRRALRMRLLWNQD